MAKCSNNNNGNTIRERGKGISYFTKGQQTHLRHKPLSFTLNPFKDTWRVHDQQQQQQQQQDLAHLGPSRNGHVLAPGPFHLFPECHFKENHAPFR